MNTDLMFSSATGKWDTPKMLIDDLSTVFDWDLDVCASRPNVCEQYYSEENSAFNHAWYGLCWMNPVYGDPIQPCKKNCKRKLCKERGFHDYETYVEGICDWMTKARDEWENSIDDGILDTKIVCLVPARVDTAWWQDNIPFASQVVCIRGRLKFGNAANSAPFPSAFVVFGEIRKEQREKLASYGWSVPMSGKYARKGGV